MEKEKFASPSPPSLLKPRTVSKNRIGPGCLAKSLSSVVCGSVAGVINEPCWETQLWQYHNDKCHEALSPSILLCYYHVDYAPMGTLEPLLGIGGSGPLRTAQVCLVMYLGSLVFTEIYIENKTPLKTWG